MALTLMKCPSCGANLDINIDRDTFYCPYCGAKISNVDKKIVIETVNRTIDEAAIEKVRSDDRIANKGRRTMVILFVLFMALAIVLLCLDNFNLHGVAAFLIAFDLYLLFGIIGSSTK